MVFIFEVWELVALILSIMLWTIGHTLLGVSREVPFFMRFIKWLNS